MNNIIFFDTETNGFPRNGIQPRIIQLAWMVCDLEGKELSSWSSLIRPNGWVIPEKDFWIQHGYSTEKNEKFGLDISGSLNKMMSDINKHFCSHIVAHNLSFDAPILASEMGMAGIELGRKLGKVCTMKSYAAYTGGKWPKLIEAHQELLGKGFEGAHDAMEDVRACARIFFEMLRRGIIKL